MGIGAQGRARRTMELDSIHTPVMLERTLELLAPALERPDAVVLDGTLGLGGHSLAVLERFAGVTLVGVDRDPEALALASRRLERHLDRVHLVHTVYDDVASALAGAGTDRFDAVLLDLGVSSLQLDRPERGFSYSRNAPLDMRMDAGGGLTAEAVLAEYSEEELARIFRDYGEEKLARRFAERIVESRRSGRLRTTTELAELIAAATPRAVARKGHPAKRVFQALRIEVNQELATLDRALPRLDDALTVGGRIVVLAYHSLEDRIVKREFAARSSSSAPYGLPVELPEHRPEFVLLTRGAEQAPQDERDSNPRATPVRLRAAERRRAA